MDTWLSKEQVIDIDLQSLRTGINIPVAIMKRNMKNLVMSNFSILDILIWLNMESHKWCESDPYME